MTHFIVYDELGKILRTGDCAEADFEYQAQPGEFVLEGLASCNTHYVVNGEVVSLPVKPSTNHAFNYTTSEWELDVTQATRRALKERDRLLANGPDRINPIWWGSMTPAQQSAWESYRQALLDITNQPGYPMTIDWPNKPE